MKICAVLNFSKNFFLHSSSFAESSPREMALYSLAVKILSILALVFFSNIYSGLIGSSLLAYSFYTDFVIINHMYDRAVKEIKWNLDNIEQPLFAVAHKLVNENPQRTGFAAGVFAGKFIKNIPQSLTCFCLGLKKEFFN